MKMEELRELSVEDLRDSLKRLQNELFKLRMQAVQGRMTRPSEMGKTKRTIARIKTFLRKKELEQRSLGGEKK